MEGELNPLPFTKHQRVWFELLRTAAALTTVCINSAIFLKVFKVI
jgi:hypothetical protein